MKQSRGELYYRTDKLVRKGDEFYHVVLKHQADSKKSSYWLEVFHGFAGTPPKEPEKRRHFNTGKAADNAFDRIVAEIEGRGFRIYSESMHGRHDF